MVAFRPIVEGAICAFHQTKRTPPSAAMKPTARFLNVGRGATVDEPALVAADLVAAEDDAVGAQRQEGRGGGEPRSG